MHYYRHGETVFASLLPDLPLEAADRPTSGSPGLFLIDRDPVSGRSSFCVSDVRQLTAGTEDVSWLDPARMGVPAPVLPKRIQHTIDARLLRAVNIRHPRWAEFAMAPSMQLPPRVRVNLLAVGDVGSTLLTALKLIGGDVISSIGICDLNQNTVARWTAEMILLFCLQACTPKSGRTCNSPANLLTVNLPEGLPRVKNKSCFVNFYGKKM